MSLNDEIDYIKLEKEDLVARLMGAQMLTRFVLRGYSAQVSYGVNFMDLPEWKDMAALEEAYKLRPYAAQWKVVAWMERLDNALSAAIRRKQFKLHQH
ncbi:hypothetical protein [Mesorhizobium sp. WSM4982]|uniref:hypothetical protein n=1 Tax=Mesorhizobium sp. WSM4982 TaxID=3038550 RepID=UPI002415932B|nr:hypothetical protein [Mesorhizobium sp. WSM4982]MDG4856412.1 hypothetical protein [Mesorhizobium sp. WSM4982]